MTKDGIHSPRAIARTPAYRHALATGHADVARPPSVPHGKPGTAIHTLPPSFLPEPRKNPK